MPDPANRDVLSDHSGSQAELEEILGKPMTAEDWVENAGWWIERGGALPEASPMFKALVDVVQECQRRSADRDRLQAEVSHLRAGISWVRGMCSDEEPLTEIDHHLGEVLAGSPLPADEVTR